MIFEVCVDTIQSAIAAEQNGAHRIEFCAALSDGGLTPTLGFLEVALRSVSLPLYVMIRPRGGDFLYSDLEFEIMKRDALAVKAAGAHGLVFGLLTPQGHIDRARVAELAELARPLPVVFHRAFDRAADPFDALETLIDLGFERLLTSGQQPSVDQGLPFIAELAKAAGDRISVMPGGGVSASNVAALAAIPGVREVHFSGSDFIEGGMVYRPPAWAQPPALYRQEYQYKGASPAKIQEIIRACR